MNLETVAKDNYGKQYPVAIEDSRYGNGPVLVIDGTPGSWYVHIVIDNFFPNGLAIDFGQGWICTNIDDIISELRKLREEGKI